MRRRLENLARWARRENDLAEEMETHRQMTEQRLREEAAALLVLAALIAKAVPVRRATRLDAVAVLRLD